MRERISIPDIDESLRVSTIRYALSALRVGEEQIDKCVSIARPTNGSIALIKEHYPGNCCPGYRKH